ncbi:MAG TPA: universal stress protein [Hyphomicrobiaceae bacterium]|nr:universal stress protein [Hyphomicrobiaceae bacterium]
MYKNILIATDGSELANKAIDQGLGLAKALGAKVTLLTATEPWTAMVSGEAVIAFPTDEYEKASAEHAKATLSAPEAKAKAMGVACEALHAKDAFPADAIVEVAKQRGCDLIVMASHGRRGMSRLLLGSQANKVVTHSHIPVLVCR